MDTIQNSCENLDSLRLDCLISLWCRILAAINRHCCLFCRARTWLEGVQRRDLTTSPSRMKLVRICSDHFTRDMYNCPKNWKNSRLLESAIPKLLKQDLEDAKTPQDSEDAKTLEDNKDTIIMMNESCQVELLPIVTKVSCRSIGCQTPIHQNPDILRRKLYRAQARLRSQKLRSRKKQSELLHKYINVR